MTPEELHHARLGRAEGEDHEAIAPERESRFDRIMLRLIVALTLIGLAEVVALVWLRGM